MRITAKSSFPTVLLYASFVGLSVYFLQTGSQFYLGICLFMWAALAFRQFSGFLNSLSFSRHESTPLPSRSVARLVAGLNDRPKKKALSSDQRSNAAPGLARYTTPWLLAFGGGVLWLEIFMSQGYISLPVAAFICLAGLTFWSVQTAELRDGQAKFFLGLLIVMTGLIQTTSEANVFSPLSFSSLLEVRILFGPLIIGGTLMAVFVKALFSHHKQMKDFALIGLMTVMFLGLFALQPQAAAFPSLFTLWAILGVCWGQVARRKTLFDKRPY
jgi:hypothetical protein